MDVTPHTVRSAARLAALSLEDREVEALAAQLSRILDHMEVLAAAESDAGGPGGAGADGVARLRPDQPGPDPLVRPASALAPEWDQGFFAVPRLASHDRQPGDAEGIGP
jgi:aspartyl-tRNA(Asn)/glutamyl-tRNA(Gln) amidotransferase subunit C